MKANELRIGNLIYSSSGGVKYVVGTSYKTILHSSSLESHTYYEDYDSNCEPIPLTEEILLKCGFYYSDDDDEFLEYKVFKSFKFHADYSDKFSCISYRINDTTNEIKFLHQLQNLYWCLCGEELTFNNL